MNVLYLDLVDGSTSLSLSHTTHTTPPLEFLECLVRHIPDPKTPTIPRNPWRQRGLLAGVLNSPRYRAHRTYLSSGPYFGHVTLSIDVMGLLCARLALVVLVHAHIARS